MIRVVLAATWLAAVWALYGMQFRDLAAALLRSLS